MEEKNKPKIEVKDLSVTYFMGRDNETRALQNASLKIYPGEFVIFFGPSGCGKSTLLYSISGLETHAKGTILVDGENIAKMDQKQIAKYRQKKIGMVFQAFYLISTLSVLKNVLLPQIAMSIDPKERYKKAKKLLDHFGVGPQADKLPTELSGGQQQRVAISRALVNDPDIIFADEPVGNLDSKSSKDVMELISSLNKKQKKTIILVTHDPSHLDMAHRVFYMRDGKVIDVKVNEAINKEVLTELPKKEQKNISKELELLMKTYSSIAPDQLGAMLIPFKAKQIVSEALIGMSTEAVLQIEEYVKRMLISSIETEKTLDKFLDKPAELGGLGLNKQTAEKISRGIGEIVEEIKSIGEYEKKLEIGEKYTIDHEALNIRKYLLEYFDVNLHEMKALINFDDAIVLRLQNKIDKTGFKNLIDGPISKKGSGLDRRTAKKIARHLELLVLGKFKIDQ